MNIATNIKGMNTRIIIRLFILNIIGILNLAKHKTTKTKINLIIDLKSILTGNFCLL